MEHEIYVSREVKNLGHNNSAALIKKAVNMALDAEGVDVPCIVSVMLTDDEGIHRVNNEFRGVDRATDVLSFPMNELPPGEFDAGRHFCGFLVQDRQRKRKICGRTRPDS